MTARPGASRVEALDDAIKQHLTVTDGARESWAAADALEAVLSSADALRKAWAAAPREAAPDMGGCTLDLSDPDDARMVKAALKLAESMALCNGAFEYGGATFDRVRIARLCKAVYAGLVRNCERRTAPVMRSAPEAHTDEIGDEGAVL